MNNDANFKAFCADHPGLAEDLQEDHEIISDIATKLRRYGSISEKQIAFVRKLAAEVRNPPPPEQHVAAPDGKQLVRGRVVSVKYHDGFYGSTLKMTVKVETPKGSWLTWGTVPSSIDPRRGDEVEFAATLKHGNEPHFALFSRPTKARVISAPTPEAVPAAA